MGGSELARQFIPVTLLQVSLKIGETDTLNEVLVGLRDIALGVQNSVRSRSL